MAEIKELMDKLPPDDDRRLYILRKHMAVHRGTGTHQLNSLDQWRDLLIRLSEIWSSFCAFYTDPAISWTKDGSKQVIGRMKMRARTVSGKTDRLDDDRNKNRLISKQPKMGVLSR